MICGLKDFQFVLRFGGKKKETLESVEKKKQRDTKHKAENTLTHRQKVTKKKKNKKQKYLLE